MFHIKRSNGKANMFLLEGAVTAVNVVMLDLRTQLEKCLTKIYVGYINFSCDDFSMIFYFSLVNKKCLQIHFFIIYN